MDVFHKSENQLHRVGVVFVNNYLFFLILFKFPLVLLAELYWTVLRMFVFKDGNKILSLSFY